MCVIMLVLFALKKVGSRFLPVREGGRGGGKGEGGKEG